MGASLPPARASSTPYTPPGSGAVLRFVSDELNDLPLPVRRFGAKADGRALSDLTVAAGSAVVSSASYQFIGADVGKLITIAGAGAAAAVLNTTIASVSAGSATLAATPGTTIAGTGVVTFGTDDGVALQAAVTAASAAGGGLIVLPRGILVTSRTTIWASQVSMRGQGAGKSIIKWISAADMTSAVISGLSGSSTNTYKDCQFIDFEVDCDAATQATYNVAGKAFFIQHMTRGLFQNLYVHGTPASGMGVDFLLDTVFENNVVAFCGRLNGGTNIGGAGIGIGVGVLPQENIVCKGNTLYKNATWGIFFESQAGSVISNLSFAQVVGNHFTMTTSGSHGLGDCGLQRMVCTGNTFNGGGAGGDAIAATNSAFGATAGIDGLIADNTIYACNNGIVVNHSVVTPSVAISRYMIHSNKINSVRNHGILIQTSASYQIDTLSIKDNLVSKAAAGGLTFVGAGGMRDVEIASNVLQDNAQTTGTAAYKCGVAIGSPITRLRMVGNSVYDNQATKTQLYGIIVNAVAVTDAAIQGNDLSNNSTGAINLIGGGTIAGQIIDNKGYNPVGITSPTVGASPWTYTAGNTPEMLYLYGGTVSGVTKGGVTLANTSPCTVALAPNEAAVVTYSAAPTARADRQ